MKKRVRIYKKPCYECGGQTHMQSGGEFEPHMMYDPKTGKGYPAESMEDHLAMKEKGFLHKDEMPKKQFGGNQFSKRLDKELKSSYKPFSSTAPQNQNTDEVVGERKNVFVSNLSNNAFKKYAEEEQQSLQELHQQMKMGGNTSYGMYDQYGGQYPTDEYMPKMQDGGDTEDTEEEKLDPTDPYYVENLIERYADVYGTTAVKGFGDYEKGSNIHPLEQYANSGEAQRAAVIGFMEAMIKRDAKSLMTASDILNQTDLPDLMSWDWMPGSDEDKLEDMAAIAREEARAKVYDKVMGQIDEIDQNFESTSKALEKELRTKIASGKLTADGKKRVPLTAEEKAILTENLEKLNRIKGVVQKDKRSEVVKYELKGQIDWDRGNWGQAYIDYLDMYNDTFGEKDGDGKLIKKAITYDLLENISDDLRNSSISSGSYSKPDKSVPFDKRKFINDDKDTHTQTDFYLSADKNLANVDITPGKEDTEEQSFTGEENAAANEAPKQEEIKAPEEPVVQQQPKVVQPKPVQSKPVQKKPAPTYQPNVVKSKEQSGATDEDLELLLQMMGEQKKYGGNINTYQDGGQPEDYMNGAEDAFRNIYSNDELREKLNNRFMQAFPQDIQAEEQPEMFPAFENLNWYDKQTSGFDKYQQGREVFAPFRNLTWNIKEGVNNMFANPNKDYGYSTADGVQIRMNRKGDEKIDLAGTYANTFRQDPLGTVGRTLGKTAEIGARAAKNISRMREDNMYDAFNQKRKMADNQFSPVDNPLSRGNWTTNQGYFNPDLMTMQPWFTGQNYQYGGDVVEMTDEQIEEFLRAGGQIEYLD